MTIQIPKELSVRNPLIQPSVDSKGFYLYNWISFEELRKTVASDYLWLLSKLLIPFGIVVILGWLYDFYILWDTRFIWTIIGLTGVYALIFLVIIFRMIMRSWTFLHISNIVFTDTHLGIGGEIVPYTNYEIMKERIQDWGEEFEEEFMMPSKLDEKISQFKARVFTWWASKEEEKAKKESSLLDGCGNMDGCSPRWADGCGSGGCDADDMGWAVLFVVILFWLVAVYWISIRIFYALGWIFSFFIGYVFVGTMKMIVTFQWREEMQIQGLFEKLETISSELIMSKNMIIKILNNATEGSWDTGVSGVVNAFDMTIGKAWSGINLVKKLRKTLENSKYATIFKYKTFDTWTKSQILGPINEMIELLSTSLKKLDETIISLRKQIEKTPEPALSIPLETQLKQLEMQRKPLESMQDQWRGVGAKIVVGKF